MARRWRKMNLMACTRESAGRASLCVCARQREPTSASTIPGRASVELELPALHQVEVAQTYVDMKTSGSALRLHLW